MRGQARPEMCLVTCAAPRTSAPPSAPLRPADEAAEEVPPELLPFVEAMIDLCIEKLVRPLGVGSQPPETDR